jgi:hypothetical protein
MGDESKALVRYAGVIQKIHDGEISLDELVKKVAPPEEVLPTAAPEKFPTPAVITDKQKASLAKLPKVFGKVNLTERREVTEDEADALMDERKVLDEIIAMPDPCLR